MDGLTISTGNTMVDRGTTLKEIRDSKINVPAPSIDGKAGAPTFADTLKAAIQDVNTAQKTADVKMQEIATGKNHNIPEVMIAAEKADISLKLMVSVRNKIIEAYQEIMKMQV